MNQAQIVGRLTRDPEIRYSAGENQMCIASFTVAVDRKFKREGEPDADFINCKAFGSKGEFIEKYFTKGKRIGIVGRIQTGNYTNKEGQKVYFTEIICNEVEFVDNKGESGNSTESSLNDRHSEPNNNTDGFVNVPDSIDEELPFT